MISATSPSPTPYGCGVRRTPTSSRVRLSPTLLPPSSARRQRAPRRSKSKKGRRPFTKPAAPSGGLAHWSGPASTVRLLADQGQDERAVMGGSAVFEQEDPLPDAELQPPLGNGNGQLGLRQCALDVRRHIVRSLVIVPVEGDVFGNDPLQKGVEIAPDVGRRILLDQQRGRSVRDVQAKQPGRDPLALGPSRHLSGDLADLAWGGFDRQPGLCDAHLCSRHPENIGSIEPPASFPPSYRSRSSPFLAALSR